MIIGISAYNEADKKLIKEAGIGWVRQGPGFPFRERFGGTPDSGYLKNKEKMINWKKAGFKVMGVTPLPGIRTRKIDAHGRVKFVWNNWSPEWMGRLGTDKYLFNYQKICSFLAEDLKGIIPLWQVANEVNIPEFSGPVDVYTAAALAVSGARGLKKADKGLFVGTNSSQLGENAFFVFGSLLAHPGLVDYNGVDIYFGSWEKGGPEDFAGTIDRAYGINGKKILINEWGFSSFGGAMNKKDLASGKSVCELKKWKASWGKGHTPEGQAEYIKEIFKVLYSRRDKIMGMFFYRWEDQESCWQCKARDCPAEIAWGLVDKSGKPKPGFYAFKDGAKKLRS